jgi:Arc/MetJ-type ribon-helix-helix transcriptional regulator
MALQLSPEQEKRVGDALRSGVYRCPDEVIDRALEVLRGQDEWLAADRQSIDAKIRRGIEELERGEGIPEEALDAHLERLKT